MKQHPVLDQITDTRLRREVDQIIEFEIREERHRCIAALMREPVNALVDEETGKFIEEHLRLSVETYRN